MNISAKTVLTAGVSPVTIGAIAVAPAAEPPVPKAVDGEITPAGAQSLGSFKATGNNTNPISKK
jgi:hypothetical protein